MKKIYIYKEGSLHKRAKTTIVFMHLTCIFNYAIYVCVKASKKRQSEVIFAPLCSQLLRNTVNYKITLTVFRKRKLFPNFDRLLTYCTKNLRCQFHKMCKTPTYHRIDYKVILEFEGNLMMYIKLKSFLSDGTYFFT